MLSALSQGGPRLPPASALRWGTHRVCPHLPGCVALCHLMSGTSNENPGCIGFAGCLVLQAGNSPAPTGPRRLEADADRPFAFRSEGPCFHHGRSGRCRGAWRGGEAAARPLGVRGAVVSGEAGPRSATPCPAVGHGAAAPAREPLTSIPRRGGRRRGARSPSPADAAVTPGRGGARRARTRAAWRDVCGDEGGHTACSGRRFAFGPGCWFKGCPQCVKARGWGSWAGAATRRSWSSRCQRPLHRVAAAGPGPRAGWRRHPSAAEGTPLGPLSAGHRTWPLSGVTLHLSPCEAERPGVGGSTVDWASVTHSPPNPRSRRFGAGRSKQVASARTCSSSECVHLFVGRTFGRRDPLLGASGELLIRKGQGLRELVFPEALTECWRAGQPGARGVPGGLR